MNRSYLLDTNVVSYAASGRSPEALGRIARQPVGRILISVISYAEIRFGLARRPAATRLAQATEALFVEAVILPWTADTADIHASIRIEMARAGKSLDALDMLIAAHALDAGAVLVSSDRAFLHVPGLDVEDWTA